MTGKNYALSYAVTDVIIGLAVEIGELVGVVALEKETGANLQLRLENQTRNIHSSLAIDNNSLSLKQVRDAIAGKRVSGIPYEIREAKNTYEAYNLLSAFDPFSKEDMLSAHKVLMEGLTKEAGNFRSGKVELFAEKRLACTAPPALIVPKLMRDLVIWAENSEVHPLIKSCVFHYEFEFIHPFAHGNGRMARMWQTLLLSRWKPFFAWAPVETLTRNRRKEYRDILATHGEAVDSTVFIEFMLNVIRDALQVFLQSGQITRLLAILGEEALSSKEMMARLKLKSRPVFRENYLLPALSSGMVEMTIPDKPDSNRQRYRAVKCFDAEL